MLKAVANRWSADRMAGHLTEYTDDEFSASTVRRALKGLSGEKKRVPKKYHVEDCFLKKISEHPDNAINYAVTDDGRAVIRGSDMPLNLRMVSDTSELGLGFKESRDSGGVRPHKCWSRELVKRESGEASGDLSWGDRRAVMAEKEIHWEEVSKELPQREQSEVGELVHRGGVRLILFENSVLVRFSLPESDEGIFEVLDEWWSTRRRALDWLESTFPVKVRSTPLDVSMPLSTQEWGDVRNSFAEWIRDNPEFQDDSPNSLFEVKNDRGERVFHIDTSPSDELGNDLAEGEFPHSQFGAGHITNMKQAVKWMATLGVKPQDFTCAQWTRRNHGELEKVVELDAEQLEARVDDLEASVVSVEDGVDSLESQVTRLEGMVEGVASGVQQNREWISDVEDRVGDAVERVDATRREASRFRDDVEDEFNSVEREIRSVESWMGDELEVTRGLIQEEVGGVRSDVESVESRVESLDSSFQDFSRVQRRQNQRMIQELVRIRRLQERTLIDKARSTVEQGVEACKSVIGSAKEKVSNW